MDVKEHEWIGRALTEEEHELNRGALSACKNLLEAYGMEDPELEIDALEALHASWLTDDSEERLDGEDFCVMVGIAFGECLRQHLGLSWAVVEDDEGRDLCVQDDVSGFQAFPIDAIAKRLAGKELFMAPLFAAMVETFEDDLPSLEDEVFDRIKALCSEGDGLAEKEDWDGALEKFQAARGLLPEPEIDWEAATWILTAIGDTQFLAGRHAEAVEALTAARAAPDGGDNPFISLRLGQALLASGDTAGAKEELALAHTHGGNEIFEDEDAKYLALATGG